MRSRSAQSFLPLRKSAADGNSGRDYARDEKSAYDEGAKRIRDALDNAKKCK